MNIPQNIRVYMPIAPATVNGTTATVFENIDTSGASYVLVGFNAGTIGAADASALKLVTSDDGVTYSDITGAAMTAPVSTSDNGKWVWLLDLKNITVKRYIAILFTMGAANATVCGWAVVFYPNIGPINATQMQVSRQLIIL